MRIEPTPIPGLFQISVTAHADERGLFARTYCAEEFRAAGIAIWFDSADQPVVELSRGTLRGMHWQATPALEAKLVRSGAGADSSTSSLIFVQIHRAFGMVREGTRCGAL